MNPVDYMRSPFFHRGGWVQVSNQSGEVIPSFAVMRITNWAVGNNNVGYLVAKPDSTYRWEYLVNGPASIAAASGAEGWATFLGSGGLVYFGSGTPALNERWGPTSGQWYLTQHRPGFKVNGANTETFNGTSLLCANQIPPGEVRVQNDSGGAVAANGSATMSLFGGSAGTTDIGLDVTLTNGSSVSWATTKYGFATYDAGGLIFGAPHQT